MNAQRNRLTVALVDSLSYERFQPYPPAPVV